MSQVKEMTAKQESLIDTLMQERTIEDGLYDRLAKTLRVAADPEEPPISTKQASAIIGWLLEQPRKPGVLSAPGRRALDPGAPKHEPVDPGVYEVDDQVYVVQWNQAKTGVYAKKLVESGTRITEKGEYVDFDFEYERGAIRRIRPEHLMPLDRAQELCIRYGRCIRCGAKLKAAKSVERGIGPVCVKYFAPAQQSLAVS